ncbi:hypothetical protein [Paenibacillus planticolens]|uniref:Lipoprotein n=1 Tax=Paenibacillus planticolens TaxID=2654976 RepID=A0ABX1ZEL9_9BACL|nr:hypothetical protein [Paenibacillus planticolens]NOU98545.1 hypothetical protein [Paenibacillus planticolens]
MKKRLIIFLLNVLLLGILSSCTDTKKPEVSDSQSLKIIIFQGLNYRVSDEKVDDQGIEQKVGEVKSYSNKSGEHYVVDAFSNAYQIGTELYKIKDNDVKEAIAVKTEDTFLKAVRR